MVILFVHALERYLISRISCYLYPYIPPLCICLWLPKCLGNFLWCYCIQYHTKMSISLGKLQIYECLDAGLAINTS